MPDDEPANDQTPPVEHTATIRSEAWASSAQLQPGDRVDHYVIRETLGEGGFAVVYAAEQEKPVWRKVALKIIKLGMDTKQVIARFEAERQALAMMDHPHVAQVFDGGATETGRPYFVMECVAGTPINEYCDRQRLNLEERLQLFIQVCEAVQHAHQKAIIHRDIKPSNVLVATKEGQPQVKVIDFGVAKAITQRLTEKTIYTEQGQLIGTPEYMSPEQAEMTADDIDTRSDVYSLGVLLYELLTGALPFDPATLRRAAFGEIQRIIREVEPPKPSTKLSSLDDKATTCADQRRADPKTLRRALRGDLDWIVMKALAKDRSRRYASASELARDVHRHRRGDPVEAAPPSTLYQLSRFVRRNQVGLNTFILICLFATGMPLVLMTAWAAEGNISGTLALVKVIAIIAFVALPGLAALASTVMFLLSRNRRSSLNLAVASTLAVLLAGLMIVSGSERGKARFGLTPMDEEAPDSIDHALLQWRLYQERLAKQYVDQWKFDEAESVMLELVSIENGDISYAMGSLIDLYDAWGKPEKADEWRATLAVRRAVRGSALPESKNAYAWLLLTCEPADLRNSQAALLLAVDANEMTGFKNPACLDTLSLAYHHTGDTAKAIENQRKAIELLPPGESETRAILEAALADFEAALADQAEEEAQGVTARDEP